MFLVFVYDNDTIFVKLVGDRESESSGTSPALFSFLFCRWLDYLLKRIIIQAKMLMNYAARNREEVKQKMEEIHLRLEKIKIEKDKVTEELAKDLEACINYVVRQLTEYLSSEDVKKFFTTWEPEEVPVGFSSWGGTKEKVTKLLSSRLREVIKKWEEDNKVFSNAHGTFMKHVQQRLNSVSIQLDELQRDVTAFVWGPTRQDDSFTRQLPWEAAALFGSFFFSDVFNWLRYGLSETTFMKENSTTYLFLASKPDVLTNFVKDKFSGSQHLLDEIEIYLPKLIKAEEKLYALLETEKRTLAALREVYQPLKDKGSSLRGELAVFGIRNVCAVDIKSEDLLWKEDESSRLGSGVVGAVYRGQMRRNEELKNVALKVYKEELAASNASAVVKEVEFLRWVISRD